MGGEGGLSNLLQYYNRGEGSTGTPNLYYVINEWLLKYFLFVYIPEDVKNLEQGWN